MPGPPASGSGTERALLVRALWLFAAAMVIHELEEWNIAAWSARNFTNFTGVSDAAIRLGVLFVSGVVLLWIWGATRLRSPLAISLAALPAVGVVAIGNAVQHVTWTILFAEYAPGVVSAVLLVVPASSLALWRMIEARRALLVPIAGCALLWVAATIQTVHAGRSLQPFQVVLQNFFMSLAAALGLPG